MKKVKIDIISSTVLLIFCAITWLILIPEHVPIVSQSGGAVGVNSQTFPYFAVAVTAISSAILLVVSIIKLARLKHNEPKKKQPKANLKSTLSGEIRALIVFLLFVAFAVLFNFFGYIVASIIVPPLVLLFMGSRNKWHYLCVYAFSAIIFSIFQFVLQVRLI